MLRFGLAEDNTVNLVKRITAGPIVIDGLDLESGGDEFTPKDFLRHAMSAYGVLLSADGKSCLPRSGLG